jgi:chromosome segregation ATPase
MSQVSAPARHIFKIFSKGKIMIIGIVIAVVVLVAIGAIVSPQFRATLQIWNRNANNAATTKTDRNKNDLFNLNKQVQELTQKVASVQASAEVAEKDLASANADLDKLKTRATTLAAQLSPEGKTELGNQLIAAKAKVTAKAQAVEVTHKASELALQSLQSARGNLETLAASVEEGATKEEVTATLQSAAKIASDTTGFNSRLGGVADRNREIDHDYIAAQKALELAQTGGNTGAAEIDKLQKAADAQAALDEALGNKPAAAPAADADKK